MNGSGANVAGCASCAGRCCRQYRVEVSVADVRALATGTGLHPGEFVRLWENTNGQLGFRLRPGGPGNALNLIRHEDGACVFLMEIAEGVARCGVYAHRPVVCRNFPTTMRRGVVVVRQDVLCPPGSWNLAAMDVPGYRRDLDRRGVDWAAHWEIVNAWNASVDATGTGRTPTDLYEFLVQVPLLSG
jgi:Fe-S-cluster containining protein